MSIGVFDSGIGGLTVYKAISLAFPKLDMIYFGDSARVPYGNKSPEAIKRYSLECAKYLTSRYNLEAFVVACNTASSHALDILHEELKIPVLGVIKPGAKKAADVTKNKSVAVIATHATVNSNSYKKAISNINSEIDTYQLACPLFVPLVEEALIDGDMVDTVVKESLKKIKTSSADTVILGCTHYPVLRHIIEKHLPNLNIVDSTDYIIKDINELNINTDESGLRQIYITDESHAFHSLKTLLVGDIPVKVVSL